MGIVKNSVSVIRFIIVGTMNAIIIAVVVWLMMHHFECNYLVSNIVAYTLAQINNYLWCKYWVFISPNGKFQREIPLFLIAFGCAYLAQFFLLLLLVKVFHFDKYLAQFIGLCVYGVINYIMNRKVTFRLMKQMRQDNKS